MRDAETSRALLFTTLGWCLVFGAFIVLGGVPVYRDLLVTYLPLNAFWAERVQAGALPQWFPFEGLGEPFVGQGVTATFHPSKLLYLLFNAALALRLEISLTILFGMVGQTLLVRALSRSDVAAVSSAFVLGLNGYALSSTCNPPYLRGLCSLPWIALFAFQVINATKPLRAVVALGVVWSLITLGGDAEGTVLGAAVCLAMPMAFGWNRRAALLLVGAVIAALLAAPEWLPGSLQRTSSIIADFRDATFLGSNWALHAERLPELLLPRFTPSEVMWPLTEQHHETGRWAESIFLGVVPLALALTPGRNRAAWVFFGVGVLGLWLALGSAGGLEWLLRTVVPLLNTIRYPEKHLALAMFGFATAAAFGADQLRTNAKPFFLALAGLLALAAVACLTPMLSTFSEATKATWQQAALISFAVAALTTIAAVGVVLISKQRAAIQWLLPALVLLSLWQVPWGLKTVPSDVVFPAPLVTTKAGPVRRVWNEGSSGQRPTDEASLLKWASETHARLEGDLGALWQTSALTLSANLPFCPKRVRALLGWDLAATRHTAPLFGFGVAVTAANEHLALEPAPRVWVGTPSFIKEPAEMIRAIREAPTQTLVNRPLVLARVTAAGADAADAPGSARIESDEVERLTVHASLARAGLLVDNDLFVEGWTVTVDGQPRPILPTNGLMRGVQLDPGEHTVVFSFKTPGLERGFVLAACGWLVALVLLIIEQRRRESNVTQVG